MAASGRNSGVDHGRGNADGLGRANANAGATAGARVGLNLGTTARVHADSLVAAGGLATQADGAVPGHARVLIQCGDAEARYAFDPSRMVIEGASVDAGVAEGTGARCKRQKGHATKAVTWRMQIDDSGLAGMYAGMVAVLARILCH